MFSTCEVRQVKCSRKYQFVHDGLTRECHVTLLGLRKWLLWKRCEMETQLQWKKLMRDLMTPIVYQPLIFGPYLLRPNGCMDQDVTCNAAKTRNPLKLPGVPQTNETISAASVPKF